MGVEALYDLHHEVEPSGRILWVCLDHDNPDEAPMLIEAWAMSAPSDPSAAAPLSGGLALILAKLTTWGPWTGLNLEPWSEQDEKARDELGWIYMIISGKIMRCVGIYNDTVEAVRNV